MLLYVEIRKALEKIDQSTMVKQDNENLKILSFGFLFLKGVVLVLVVVVGK